MHDILAHIMMLWRIWFDITGCIHIKMHVAHLDVRLAIHAPSMRQGDGCKTQIGEAETGKGVFQRWKASEGCLCHRL